MNAPDRELWTALIEHGESRWIPELHQDECEDLFCRRCVPASVTRYRPSPAEVARQAAALEHLAQVAAELHESPAAYERHGIDIEWHHQLDDPAVPPLLVRPHLTTGGQS